MPKKPKSKRITFRLPPDLARQVEQSKGRLSLNTQLVILVERGLKA